MKKFILGFIIGALLFSIIPVSAAVQEYMLQKSDAKLMVDGKEHADKELPVLNYKGYNYLPAAAFRGICDKIGVGFNWDNAKKEIQITTVGQASEKEGDNVSRDTVQELTIDTMPVHEFDGKEYVSYSDINNMLIYGKYDKYSFGFRNDLIAYFHYFPDPSSVEVIIDEVRCKKFQGNNDIFIDYNIWLNQIVPVLKGE